MKNSLDYGDAGQRFLYVKPVIEKNMKRFSDLSDQSAFSAVEAKKLKEAINSLTELVSKKRHIPSMDLLGRVLITGYVRFYAVQGFEGQFGNDYRNAIAKRGLSEKQFLTLIESQARLGVALLAKAAKSGYAPSTITLSQLRLPNLTQKITPPEIANGNILGTEI